MSKRNNPLSQLRRTQKLMNDFVRQMERVHAMSIPEAAGWTGISEAEIRENCKIVRVNKTRHVVTLNELESFQQRRIG